MAVVCIRQLCAAQQQADKEARMLHASRLRQLPAEAAVHAVAHDGQVSSCLTLLSSCILVQHTRNRLSLVPLLTFICTSTASSTAGSTASSTAGSTAGRGP